MSQRIETEGDEANRFPHAAEELSASSQPPHRASHVIPFPQSRSAAISASAAAGSQSPREPAAFIQLGDATQALVMRLANKRVRLRMLSQTTREEEE